MTIANDASASLSQKVALFGASAVMTPQDRTRLDGLLSAVERQQQAGETLTPEREQSRSPAAEDTSHEAEVALRPFAAVVPVALARRVEVALIPSSSVAAGTFTPEELAHLQEMRRAFLLWHGITPRDGQDDADA